MIAIERYFRITTLIERSEQLQSEILVLSELLAVSAAHNQERSSLDRAESHLMMAMNHLHFAQAEARSACQSVLLQEQLRESVGI